MIRTALVLSLAALALGGPALASEGGSGLNVEGQTDPGFSLAADSGGRALAPHCKPIVKLKADFDEHTHFTKLSPGQFHFVEGVYVGSPATPEGLPPGDGALLAQHDGDKDGVIVWTRGALACAPLPIPEKLIKLMGAIKMGALDDDDQEL
jgi:hypothetical protein